MGRTFDKMGRTFDKSVLVGVGLVVAFLVVNAGLAYRNTRQLFEDAKWVAHTQEVLDLTSDLLSTLVDAETGQRGFFITGKEDFLEPYQQAIARLDRQVRTLKDKTQDNPRQLAHIGELERLTAQQLALLQQGIDLRRKSAEEAQAFTAAGKGKAKMDARRRVIVMMEEEEHGLLRDRERQSAVAYRTAVATDLIAATVGLVLVGFLIYLVRRSLGERIKATALVYEERERLHTTLTSIGDAVIVTDTQGRVTLMNRVAQDLTGWTGGATNRPLEEVFRIVNEQTRQSFESPATSVMREGVVVSLANHTVLIARGGREVPIDDSSAPIRCDKSETIGVVPIFRDVTEQRQAEQALRDSEQRFTRFMDHLPVLAWIKDLRGRYVYANDAAMTAFTISRAELYGKTDAEVFPPETAAQFRENDRRVLDSGTGVQVIETLEHEDGFLHHSLVSKFPILGSDGQMALIGGMAIDVTDRLRAEESLREADRRKDEFLALLAHELRNPLAPIRNALHIMKQAGADAAVVGRVREMMERQVRHMTRMVDDLLDVSRITRGKIELRKETVDLATVVDRTVEAGSPLIEDRQQELTVDLPPEPLRLEADPTRLEQILANLLNNAAKYTDHGGHVWLSVRQEGGELVLRVRDTGVGIAADMLARIFEPFMQADRVLHQSQGGLGIGLTLVRRLVEMHGGSVTAHSDGPGKGSEFVVRLPALLPRPPVTGVTAAGEGGEPEGRAPHRRILVVDDNVDAAESLALLLRMEGHEARAAHDGPAALAVVEAAPPDLVFLDIGMPVMNGYDVARRLRQQPGLGNVVLVALTGWGQEEDRRRSEEAGFDRHLVKPAEPEVLRQLLARLR